MRTHIRPEDVRFGTVERAGKHWIFVTSENNPEGKAIRLCWSHLRRAEVADGRVLLATGQRRKMHDGDRVAYVPRANSFWMWALRDEYDEAVNAARSQTTSILSEERSRREKEVKLEPELERVLGRRQLDAYYRRFPQQAQPAA